MNRIKEMYPTTRSGWQLTVANSLTEREDVFVAKINGFVFTFS